MAKQKLQGDTVYSPIDDSKIRGNISGSAIWKTCYKEEEVTDEVLNKHKRMYAYTMNFDGLVPVQVTKIEKVY